MVEISEAAQSYLAELLGKQEHADTAIRIFVSQPGTPHAETCIAYCRPGEEQADDERVEYPGFTAWFELRSASFLVDAKVDFQEDKMGGQLTIKAPNSRLPNIDENSPLEDKVNYVLHNEINPGLAAHGGMVTLVEILEGGIAVLQFGGGCQGCAAVDMTLKNGVEKTLLEQISELSSIQDATDHSITDKAYY
ncbi:MAG: Fe-S biogenesis protein NfuA [Pseudomonadales bacterium]|nr:Fe-S biogenesis protein NfuA [Pseudomonadales bacterium]